METKLITNHPQNNGNIHTNFSFEQKKKLLEKIHKIKNKIDLVKVFKIIIENNGETYSHNNNGIFMVFDKLSCSTYNELEKLVDSIINNNQPKQTLKQEYVPYAKDEITEQMGGKHKFSNKERALIKRNAYEGLINSDKSSDVIYTDFMIATDESSTQENSSPVLKK